jgi:hypothetical protein
MQEEKAKNEEQTKQ